jgi:hypothetical protein
MLLPHIIVLLVLLTLVVIAFIVRLISRRTMDVYDRENDFFTFVLAALSGGFLVGLIAGLFPFQSEYWVYSDASGTVAEVSNQFTSGSGNNTSESFILNFESDDRVFLLSDPRASVLTGKTVDLSCTTEWVFRGADRYNCVIAEVR